MVQNIVNHEPNIEKKTTALFKLGNAATTTTVRKRQLKSEFALRQA